MRRGGIGYGLLWLAMLRGLALSLTPPQACAGRPAFTIELDDGEQVTVTDGSSGQMWTYADRDLDAALEGALSHLPSGGCVQIGAGRYHLDRQVVLPSGVSVVGATRSPEGDPATVIELTAPIGNTFWILNRDAVTLANLRIEAHDLERYLVSIRCSREITIRNVQLIHPNGAGFASSGCRNCLFDRCEAVGTDPTDGYGFVLGGSADGIGDVGTRVVNSRASGFNHPTGGQGLLTRSLWYNTAAVAVPTCGEGIRCTVVCPGGWPVCDGGPLNGHRCDCQNGCNGTGEPTRDFQIVGGEFHHNRVGIWIEDVVDPVITNASVFDNSQYGLYVAGAEASEASLPAEQVHVSVIGGQYFDNGGAGGTYRDENVTSEKEAGVRLFGTEGRVEGADIHDNKFSNLVLEGDRFTLERNRFGSCGHTWGGETAREICDAPPCLDRHVYLELLRDQRLYPVSLLVRGNVFDPVAGGRAFGGPLPTVPGASLLTGLTGLADLPPAGARCPAQLADDGDPCTVERCTARYCVREPASGVDEARCACRRAVPACALERIPRSVRAETARACALLATADGRPPRLMRYRARRAAQAWRRAARALTARSRDVSPTCADGLSTSLTDGARRARHLALAR